jgi:hypothetical protein
VKHTQHPELSAQAFGIGGQILQGLGAAAKEQVQRDLLVGADEVAQGFRHREGHQEVRRGQQQALALVLEPGIGISLPALWAMPVVTGMIAVEKAGTVRALEELPAQSRGAASQDLFQDLPMPMRHDGAEMLSVLWSQSPEQLMNREALTTVAGGGVHQRLLMN